MESMHRVRFFLASKRAFVGTFVVAPCLVRASNLPSPNSGPSADPLWEVL